MAEHASKFTSYSANFEDVILNRLFAAREDGFFVDVGAAHPKMENDCKALYDRGWRGINIEPNPRFFEDLQVQRPGDVSLRLAIDESEGLRTYFWIDGSGLSTLDEAEALRCEGEGWAVQRLDIATAPLRDILARHAPEAIDLLKIDVEGWEEVVLRSNDWARFVPSVIVVEATLPERPVRRETGVASYLAGHGYERAYFDGLNDFYVHRSFPVPEGAFSLPPNVFDHFESYLLQELREHAGNLAEARDAAARYSEAEEAALAGKTAELAEVHARLAAETARVAEIGAREQEGALRIMKLEAAMKDALDAQSRAHHDAVRRADDVQRLQASVARLQASGLLYAQRAQESHAEREELLRLRDLARAELHIPPPPPASPEAPPEPLTVDLSPYLDEIARLRDALADCSDDRDDARAWLEAIRVSSSWRLTRPMRVLGKAVVTVSNRLLRR